MKYVCENIYSQKNFHLEVCFHKHTSQQILLCSSYTTVYMLNICTIYFLMDLIYLHVAFKTHLQYLDFKTLSRFSIYLYVHEQLVQQRIVVFQFYYETSFIVKRFWFFLHLHILVVIYLYEGKHKSIYGRYIKFLDTYRSTK